MDFFKNEKQNVEQKVDSEAKSMEGEMKTSAESNVEGKFKGEAQDLENKVEGDAKNMFSGGVGNMFKK